MGQIEGCEFYPQYVNDLNSSSLSFCSTPPLRTNITAVISHCMGSLTIYHGPWDLVTRTRQDTFSDGVWGRFRDKAQ